MSSMFETILGSVTPETTQSIAGRLGESPAATQHGVGAATAATLYGLARNSANPGFTDQLMQMLSRAASPTSAGSLTSLATGTPTGAAGDLTDRFASLVFGSQQGEIARVVSQHSGLAGAAGGGILKTAAALVLGHLARLHGSGSLTANNFANTLRAEGATLENYVPGSFLSKLGETTTDGASRASTYTSNVLHATESRIPEPRRNRWLLPLAAVAFAAVLLGWVASRMTQRSTVARTTARNEVAVASLGSPVSISLPDGTQLTVPANGVETKLVTYLRHPGADPQGAQFTWYFDRLPFNSGQASLAPTSAEQLDNVAAVLKAYPNSKVLLGGYTDNTGDANANQRLSEERANSVMTALVQRGIDPSRLSAKGYGDEDPVADNSTPEGRQQNRRIAIRVAEK